MEANSKINILLVDDNEENLIAMRAVLEELGENLVTANTGRKALRLMLDREFALVLLDVSMPDMDGFEVATLTRQLKKLQHIPIIFLTAINQSEHYIFKGYSLGAVDYLCKPIEPEILKSKVRVFIDLYRKRAELKRQAALLEQTNKELDELNEVLERRIRERTIQLQLANEELRREVAERKQAEEERERLLASEQAARAEAEAANCLKDEFLATVSHELRTPLSAIIGWISMLRAGKLNAADTAKAFETIERNAKTQAQLINDLLDVSRIITGKLRLEVQPVDLALVIQDCVETVQLAAVAKRIELEVAVGSEPSLVSGDPARLKQIVWNLLTNAIKFTPEGGRVETELKRIGTNSQIAVRDTGQGISPKFLPYVFDRFRQADGSITRRFGGLGLGLAIVRNLVELHGGTVCADSPGEGQGSTFTVNLPIRKIADYESPAIATASQTSAVKPSANGKPTAALLAGLRVLAIDDQADARELLNAILTQYSAEVKTAATVREALGALQHWQPDLLVCDIGMPEEDGYDLIRQVRALAPECGGRIPAVALTAYAGDENCKRALAAGYQAYLPKPVETTELLAIIASLGERRI